jgi:hypothetical protein
MSEHFVTCSLLKKQKQVVFDYTKNPCSLTFTVSVIENKVRAKKVSTAVFKMGKHNTWYPHHIEVVSGYKRKGIATIMYDIVQSEINGTLVPSDEQSNEAKAFWKNRLDKIQK